MKYISWKDGVPVESMQDGERKHYKLSTSQTRIEVHNDPALMQEMRDYCFQKGIVGFDSETTGLDVFRGDRIELVQIGDIERQYLIWVRGTDLDLLWEVLWSEEVLKVGLNLKFDLLMAQVPDPKGRRVRNIVDAILTAQTLTCGIYDNVGLNMKMTGMEMQAKHWLGLEIPKDLELRTGWTDYHPDDFPKFIHGKPQDEKSRLVNLRRDKMIYAADDVCIPLQLIMLHKPWLQSLGLTETVNLESRFLPVITDIEARGLYLDVDAWNALSDEAKYEVKKARRALDELFDVEVTIEVDEHGKAQYFRDKKYTSPAQLVDMIREWMWENCGVEVIATNQHFRDALARYGKINPVRLETIFTPVMMPDPEDPKKKVKVGYPNQKDIISNFWDLYKDFLPPDAFILEDTDSKNLKFLRSIYEAPKDIIRQDQAYREAHRFDPLPTTVGLPPALVDPILALRGFSKSVSTYGDNWLELLTEDGRVHTDFRQNSLSTGRLSSSPNVQNFPADAAYRACFKARPGYKIVGADYSQIEPRVLAHLCHDPTYMRVFWSEQPGSEGHAKWCRGVTEELDLYTEVGKEIGQIPEWYTKVHTKGDEAQGIEALPEGMEGRKQAKVANLGLGYGTGLNKFHKMLCIDTHKYQPLEHTKNLYDTYWESMGTSKAYLDASSDLASPRSTRVVHHPYSRDGVRYAESLIGRKRFFTEDNPVWWTTARNMPIQASSGGDMLKLAAIYLTEWAWSVNIDGGLINLIHDELLAEVREDQAELYAEKMQYFMEKVGRDLCPTVPIKAEAYISDYWEKK